MRSLSAAIILLCLACSNHATPTGESPLTGADIAIVGATVIPMTGDGERLTNHTVVISGDRIVAVGPSAGVVVPPDAERIDGRGRFLVPGLAEMHGHIPPPAAGAQQIEDTLFLYVSNGITTVRGMLGAPGQLELRTRAASGELLSPTLYLAGPSFNGNSISSPADAVTRVRAQKSEGWDLLKVHPGLTREEYDAMASTARAEEIRFGGHVPESVGIHHALVSGQETFDHMDGYLEHLEAWDRPISDAEMAPLAAATKDAGAWIVPTMALWDTLFCVNDLETMEQYPELRYVPATQIKQWSDAYRNRLATPQCGSAVREHLGANRRRMLGALHDAGVPILMGTDAPQQFSVPGFSLHRELRVMRESGMSPYAILESGTTNVGRYFSGSDSFGAIAPGQRADLILVDGDPLADLAALQRIAGVVVRGRWLSRAAIDERLDAIARRAAGR